MNIKIVKKAIKGDFNSYSILVNDIKNDGYKIAYTVLKNEEDSIDAYLQAVEKGLNNIKNLKEAKYFKTWFLKIVINEAKNIIKKNKKIISLEDYADKESYIEHDKDTKIDLERALENIDTEVQEMIRLKFYMGYTLEEIGDILELPIGTVKGKMYTALKCIRKDLEVRYSENKRKESR